MISRCNVFEKLQLYIFSAWYLLIEVCGRILRYKSHFAGQVFMQCEGRTAVVTGGTSGIGLETVKMLLSFGMNVIIGSNSSSEESETCLTVLRSLYPKRKVELWYVDLSSMQSVKDFADKYLRSELPLHILINNAGIMFAPYQITEDGLESHLAINYFSHCLLTKLLLPRMKESSSPKCKARIINVSSCLHFIGNVEFQDLNSLNSYCCHHAYTQSKLCQVMFTQYLSKFLRHSKCNVGVYALHPGIVYSSRLYKHVWWAKYLGPIFFKKSIRGAEVCVYTALAAKLEARTGAYVEECRIMRPSKASQASHSQQRLWNETWKTLAPWLDEVETHEDCE